MIKLLGHICIVKAIAKHINPITSIVFIHIGHSGVVGAGYMVMAELLTRPAVWWFGLDNA